MPRNITVTFEDGSSHVFKNAPDDLTPEQVTARAAQEFGKQVTALDGGKAESGMFDGAIARAKNLGTGLVKGFSSLATLAGDALADDPQTRMAQAAANTRQGKTGEVKVGDVSAMVGQMGYKPQNNRERIEQALAAGAGGALFGPGAMTTPLRSMAVGASAGLGGEVANIASNGNLAATVGGTLLGGGVTGVASALRSNKTKLAREALSDVRPEDLETARKAMLQSGSAGIPINLSQAMPKPSNIDSLVETLANNKYGKHVTKQLRDQPQQVAFGMEDALARLPGSVRTPQIVANNMQEAATGVIEGAKKARGAAWKKTHDAGVQSLKAQAGDTMEIVERPSAILSAGGAPIMTQTAVPAASRVGLMPESAVSSAHDRLKALAAERPNTGLGGMLDELASRLKTAEGEFITDSGQLNGVLKDVTARLKSPDLTAKGVDAGGVKFLSNTINDIREEFGAKFAPVRDANAKFAQLTEESVNPLRKSVVGDMAGRRGALPDVEAVKGRLNSVFEAGTVPGAKSSEILALEKAVRGIPVSESGVGGRAAYQDAVKTWMASKISDSSKIVQGRIDSNVAGNLHKVFMGTDTKAQGFRDMMVGMARSKDLPDNALLPGMENFMRIVATASRRPGSVQGLNSSGASQIAGQSLANAGGQTTVNPFRNLALRWSEKLQSGAYSEMDRLLTTPEGIDMLKKLAKQPATSPAAQAAVATFLGGAAAASDNEAPNYDN